MSSFNLGKSNGLLRETDQALSPVHEGKRGREPGADSVFDVLPSDCAGQSLKKEVATRTRAEVLVSAKIRKRSLTHTEPASKSNQGDLEKIDYAFIYGVPVFSLSAERN